MHTILVVEDDPRLISLLARQLARRGWRTLTASTLAAARDRLRDEVCQLLLLDLGLPDGCGWELLPEAAPRMPVVVMTCLEVLPPAPEGWRPARIFIKPLVLPELCAYLERLVATGAEAAHG